MDGRHLFWRWLQFNDGLSMAKKSAVTVKVQKAATKRQTKRVARTDPAWQGVDNIRASVSTMVQGLVRAAAKEFGNPTICTAGDAGRLCRGIAFPSFSLEYLFQNNVLALGRFLQLVGVEGTCKSGFACEVGRWFIEAGGMVVLKEHESKYSPDWPPSIVGWDNQDNFMYLPCNSINEWQQAQLWTFKSTKDAMLGTASNPGPGAIYPLLSIVDSIMAKGTDDAQGRIASAGFAGRDHAVDALSITRFLQYAPQQIANWPMFSIWVNHEKPQKVPNSHVPERNKAGGKGKEFQETYEISMSRIKRFSTARWEGLDLQMRLYKNSLGVGDRKIPITVRWWYELADPTKPRGPDNLPRQQTVFDWHGSTIDLLLQLKASKTPAATKVKDIANIQTAAQGKVWCRQLGITDSSPVDRFVLGEALAQDEAVLTQLRDAFGIKIRDVFEPGVDFGQQIGVDLRVIRDLLYNKNKKKDGPPEE